MEKTMVRQAVALQPMEVHGGADIHLQPMEDPMLEQVDEPEGGCDSMGSPHWSRFAGRTCDPAGDPHRSSLFLKVCTPWKGPTLEQFVKNCSPRTHAGEVHGGLSPMGGTPRWSRGRV
ncbi:AN1-type zinc finger protein 5-like [Grus japonensis]|uniref:AN1-type zinc finger protein 5-like n=1 Tax=Grus japonensis TaxID=30415 RepID=A0ABC9WZM0_GRUJA